MRYEPRPYQERMTQAVLDGNCLLAARPGLGKTAATLDAVDQLVFDRIEVGQVLVVAPKIVASDTWPNEIRKWANFHRLSYRFWDAPDFGYEIRTREVDGAVVEQKLRPAAVDLLRAVVLSDRSVIHAVSRENYYNFILALGKDLPYGLQIFDESNAFSDPESSRFRAATAAQTVIPRTVLLNGTPVGNGLEKLWAQMCLVDGGKALGDNKRAFQMTFMEPDRLDPRRGKVFSWKPRAGAMGSIIERCRGQLISLREEDWLTLPDLIHKSVLVDIPMDDYRRMERELLLEFEGGAEALAVNAGVLYGKLSQIACGIAYDTEGQAHEIHRVKLDALAEIAEEHNGPLLIWTSFREDIDRIKRLLPKAQLANKVKNLEARWNAGEIPYLIAHPDSLGYGANLQDVPGGGMVWFGITGNAVWWNQGIKRIHRSGRKEPVICYSIAARGTVEQEMVARRVVREALEEDLMAALAFRRGAIR